MNNFYVYTYTVPGEDKPFYVGKGHGGRARIHLCPSRLNRYKTRFYRKLQALSAAGITPEVTIIRDGLSEAEAFRVEQELISEYGRADLGTGCLLNHTSGGEGQKNRGPETRKKLSANARAYYSDPEKRRQRGIAWMGRAHTDESRLKMSAAAKNRRASEGYRNARGRPIESYDLETGAAMKQYPRIRSVVIDGFSRRGVQQVLGGHWESHKQLGWRYTCSTSADTSTTRPP